VRSIRSGAMGNPFNGRGLARIKLGPGDIKMGSRITITGSRMWRATTMRNLDRYGSSNEINNLIRQFFIQKGFNLLWVGFEIIVLICCIPKAFSLCSSHIEVPFGSLFRLFLLIAFISKGILRNWDRTMITYIVVIGRFWEKLESMINYVQIECLHVY